MRWPMGEAADPTGRCTRCFAYFLEIALGLGLVWEAGECERSCSLGPARPPGRLGTHPWNQPRIRALTDDGGSRYDTFWRWVDTHSPNEELWQLDSIAVDPAVQRRGFGGALIQAGLDQARIDGVGAFLSTRHCAQRHHL